MCMPRVACEGYFNLMVDPFWCWYAVKMLQTQHILQLLYRKNFALMIIDYDFYCEEADLLGYMII